MQEVLRTSKELVYQLYPRRRAEARLMFCLGVYLPKDLSLELNWKAFTGPFLEIAPGMNLRHAPGHTPGLIIMQFNLSESGTGIFTTDQYHVHENYHSSVPQGWLARDHDDWVRSDQMIKALQKVGVFLFDGRDANAKAKLGAEDKCQCGFGHCGATLSNYKLAPYAYQ